MILKVKLDRKNPASWKFFPLKGAVKVSEGCVHDYLEPEFDPESPAVMVPFDNFVAAFAEDFPKDEQRDIFPLVQDEEKTIMFNLEAYLLNDEGKTIEKIS